MTNTISVPRELLERALLDLDAAYGLMPTVRKLRTLLAAAPKADVQIEEVNQIIGRLCSSDPDFGDCADAVALILKLCSEIKGPDGYATWKDAAITERLARGSMRPSPAVVELARAGLEVYSGPNMNEHKVCAEIIRLAAAPQPVSDDVVKDAARWRHYRGMLRNPVEAEEAIDAAMGGNGDE